MIHTVFLLIGLFMIGWGIVICGLLIKMSLQAKKGILLITIPGILIVLFLAFNFACHVLHLPRSILPHQLQIANSISGMLRLAAIPLLLMKLFEWWWKKRKKVVLPGGSV